ncbi:molybdate ABC transporter permease subunit [Paenibacillus sp. 1-18]|uniref:molybdate ABC transporter permease subunit n=1 Tax=Paenibacillus sp. 1-18 TaxID=1333846 RepID=UPI000472B0A0|nr:molybdate ABC transporter permease subunit [Paenibacillus sp. 1-18]
MSMQAIDWNEYWPPILLSLQVALLSSVLVILFGLFVAWSMSRVGAFTGKTVVETMLMLPLVLPPTVVGFLLLILLGRKSGFGHLVEQWLGEPIVFSWWAGVVAAVVVAFPLVYRTLKMGFSSIDRDLEDAGRSMGASEWQVFRYITFPLTFPSFKAAFILGFARSLGEFGATLMIAGNIPGKTQTIPTAIYVAVDSGHLPMAWAWTCSIILISFIMLLLTGQKND